MSTQIIQNLNPDEPPYIQYLGQESFFGGNAPLDKSVGYIVVIGFGALFSIITTGLVFLDSYFGSKKKMTSESFK